MGWGGVTRSVIDWSEYVLVTHYPKNLSPNGYKVANVLTWILRQHWLEKPGKSRFPTIFSSVFEKMPQFVNNSFNTIVFKCGWSVTIYCLCKWSYSGIVQSQCRYADVWNIKVVAENVHGIGPAAASNRNCEIDVIAVHANWYCNHEE